MSNKHILVVESSQDDAFLIRRAFKTLPFCTSFLCRSVYEAQSYLARAGVYYDQENYPAPDAILTELRLGADSGVDFIRWLEKREDLRTIPVYVFAGAISPHDEKELKALPLKKYFRKPGEMSELRKRISEIAQEICGSGGDSARV